MEHESSLLGLAVQAAGIALLAVLSSFLSRSIRRDDLRYWSAAWTCLAVALSALFLSFQLAALGPLVEALYYLGEYAFGYLLVAGCRNYVTGAQLSRRDLRALPPAALVALALPLVPGDFSARFVPQAAILAAFFAVSLRCLLPAWRSARAGPGLRIMLVALGLLILDFLHYVPVLAYSLLTGVQLPFAYRAHSSIYDLILEVLLAFGAVTLVMEDVQREVDATNRELRVAKDRLEIVARMDPLTDSLNRHAFHSLLEQNRTSDVPAGCVAVVDIDNLKPINDSFGHAAGDAAIRAVAAAVRSLVRADDLVFRWGGDEFLVLLFGCRKGKGSRGWTRLDGVLARTIVPGREEAVAVSVSYGVAPVRPGVPLERSIDEADSSMYRSKHARKAGRSPRPEAAAPSRRGPGAGLFENGAATRASSRSTGRARWRTRPGGDDDDQRCLGEGTAVPLSSDASRPSASPAPAPLPLTATSGTTRTPFSPTICMSWSAV